MILVHKRYCLAKMYGRVPGYEADRMSDVQLRRKKELCEEVLAVLDKIMPGRARKRGEREMSEMKLFRNLWTMCFLCRHDALRTPPPARPAVQPGLAVGT